MIWGYSTTHTSSHVYHLVNTSGYRKTWRKTKNNEQPTVVAVYYNCCCREYYIGQWRCGMLWCVGIVREMLRHWVLWKWCGIEFGWKVCLLQHQLWVWLWALVLPSACPQSGHCWYWYLDKLASVRERMPIQQHKFLVEKVSWMQCIDGNGNGQYGYFALRARVMNRIWVLCNLSVISRYE